MVAQLGCDEAAGVGQTECGDLRGTKLSGKHFGEARHRIGGILAFQISVVVGQQDADAKRSSFSAVALSRQPIFSILRGSVTGTIVHSGMGSNR